MGVADSTDILVSLPSKLVSELDKIVRAQNCSRNQCVQEAMQMYVLDRRKVILREQLKQGYQSMAALNLVLAEEGPDEDALYYYECRLAEAD